MICIKDKFGNKSELYPGDEIKVVRESGKESIGKYIGECFKYYECGHWHFSSEIHEDEKYCDYYYSTGQKKYLSIDELKYGKPLRISDASASTRIDETLISEIIILRHNKKKYKVAETIGYADESGLIQSGYNSPRLAA